MRILITGGCGYVGTILTNELLNKNHQVTVLDTQWFGNYLSDNPNLKIIKEDVRKLDNIDLSEIDIIYHLANIANDPSTDLNPYLSWDVNVFATMRLIDKAVRNGVKRFIFASSSSVYGVKHEPEVTEELELNPISEYNKTKMIAERIILSYKDDISTVIIRPATVCGYSPRMRLDLSVNLLTMQALKNGIITVFGGKQTRPNIYIKDLVDAYIFLLENEHIEGIFNAGFENLSIMQIAEMISEEIPAQIKVSESNDPRSYHVVSKKLLNTGFTPKHNVKFAIKEIKKEFKQKKLYDHQKFYNVNWMKKMQIS